MSDKPLPTMAIGQRAYVMKREGTFFERTGQSSVKLSGRWPRGTHDQLQAVLGHYGWSASYSPDFALDPERP